MVAVLRRAGSLPLLPGGEGHGGDPGSDQGDFHLRLRRRSPEVFSASSPRFRLSSVTRAQEVASVGRFSYLGPAAIPSVDSRHSVAA